MQLPAALQPWAQELAHLPLELAVALGPMVRRLASAIGPLRTGMLAAADEVDGLSGLGRSGPLERLLLSDWLLAEEVPDEFLRRAAERELLFLQLDRRQPRAGRRTTALFDCGPAQLGAPGIAHLALLVGLARRARAAGAELGWGALQDRACKLRALDSEDAVRELRAARSGACARADDVERWSSALEPTQPGADVWLIGAAASFAERARSARASIVEIDDALDPKLESLEVRVRAREGSAPSLRLELPPSEVCVQLIRDPYAAQRRGSGVSIRAIDASRRLHFSESSALVVCAVPDGVASIAIPHSFRENSHKYRPLHLGNETPLAAHARSKHLAALTTDGTNLYFRRGWPGNGFRALPPELALNGAAPLLPCWTDRGNVIFRDAHENLWVLPPPVSAESRPLEAELRGVAALARLNGEFYWLLRDGAGLLWCHGKHVASVPDVRMHRFSGAGPLAFVGGGSCGPLAAARTADGLWDLRSATRGELVNLPPGMPPAGIVVRDRQPRLAAVADARELALVGNKQVISLYSSAYPILDAVCAPNGSRIALHTADGAIRVLRVRDGAEILHASLEPEP